MSRARSRLKQGQSLWVLTALLALVVPGIGNAQEVSSVLGNDGTVFRLYEGTYGDLFEGGAETDPASPVLALERRHQDGSSDLLLVPGSESADQESSASMVLEDKTGVVYLVWETLFNGHHSLLQLTSFDGSAWSELIEITGNIFANKGTPRLVVLRETDVISEAGAKSELNRTTLHLTWWEESTGVSVKRHALIVLEDGQYIGWAPIIELSNFVLHDDTSAPPEVGGLENALTLQAGRNHRDVVVGFVNPRTHRLITLEIESLSRVIGSFAEKLRGEIVVIGLTAGSRTELAEMARSEVLTQGTAFHDATRFYLAEHVALTVEQSEEEFTPAGIDAIADKLRGEIVVIGSRIRLGGLENARDSEIIRVGQSPTNGGAPYHYYQVTVVSDRPAPEVGGHAELLLSKSGENVIVTWEADGHVFYSESLDEGWSEPTSILLTEDLDYDTIRRMLSERIRGD